MKWNKKSSRRRKVLLSSYDIDLRTRSLSLLYCSVCKAVVGFLLACCSSLGAALCSLLALSLAQLTVEFFSFSSLFSLFSDRQSSISASAAPMLFCVPLSGAAVATVEYYWSSATNFWRNLHFLWCFTFWRELTRFHDFFPFYSFSFFFICGLLAAAGCWLWLTDVLTFFTQLFVCHRWTVVVGNGAEMLTEYSIFHLLVVPEYNNNVQANMSAQMHFGDTAHRQWK